MPSFDIVSKTDVHEVDNALSGVAREISQRFDFKGSNCTIEREGDTLTLRADDQMKLTQMQELLRTHLTRRKIEVGALDMKPPEKAGGDTMRQSILIKQGLDRELAKKLTAEIKKQQTKGASRHSG